MGTESNIPASAALKIAEDVIRGKVKRAPSSPIQIALSGDAYTITFIHEVPPDTLGADYDAELEINAMTGEVLQFRVGA